MLKAAKLAWLKFPPEAKPCHMRHKLTLIPESLSSHFKAVKHQAD